MNYKKRINRLNKNTQKGYNTAIWKYEKYHNMTMDELITEALTEQENQIPQHKLKIIERIESFQDHLVYDEDLVRGTIYAYLGKIKTIYHRCRVNIPYIEEIDPKQLKRRPYIEYKDILTKNEIRSSLKYMRPPMQARTITMCQGGLSNEECDHLTLTSFINDLQKYHQEDDMIEALYYLSCVENPVIWVTMLIRSKTSKPYYSIIGPEAVNSIARAKLYEYNLPGNTEYELSDKLLNSNKDSFGRVCRRVNERLSFGKVAGCSKLRPHNLRRFHATRISGEDGLSYSEVDELQGRGKTSVQDTYIKTDPLHQRDLYIRVMNNLTLFNDYISIGDGIFLLD